MGPKTQTFAGHEFWLVGSLELQRTASGTLVEYSPQLPDDVRPNRHAEGLFCKFGLSAAPSAEGVYAIVVGDELKYIGECVDLSARFGPRGYGLISPRNLHDDGQSTNCKLNSRILAAAKSGVVSQVWFHCTDNRKAIEAQLLRTLEPPWNGTRGSSHTLILKQGRVAAKTTQLLGPVDVAATTHPTPFDFESALREVFRNASAQGLGSIQVTAGDLHRMVGGYPSNNHRMPVCCAKMRAVMLPGDRVVYAPPKGNGARLMIEYRLPRIVR